MAAAAAGEGEGGVGAREGVRGDDYGAGVGGVSGVWAWGGEGRGRGREGGE